MRRLVTEPAFLRRMKQQSVERAARAPWSDAVRLLEEAVRGGAAAEPEDSVRDVSPVGAGSYGER